MLGLDTVCYRGVLSGFMRVAIVGGGIIGCAAAIALRERGATCVLFERGRIGGEASGAAAGMLGAQLEAAESAPLLELFVRARDGYPAWVERLASMTGIDVGYRRSGALRLALTEDEATVVAENVARQQSLGLRAELVAGHHARAIEPAVTAELVCAAHYPDEAQVDPRRLMQALAMCLPQVKVDVRVGTSVLGLVVRDGACRGVRLEGGTVFEADAVLVAAGSWSSDLADLPADAPRLVPVKGQIALLQERHAPHVATILVTDHDYLVPRGDGRVVCGSTVERVGFDRSVTALGMTHVIGHALSIVSSLADATLLETWCNFRPDAGASVPVIEPAGVAGLFYATGHFRNGILLAKVTADRVVEMLLGSA